MTQPRLASPKYISGYAIVNGPVACGGIWLTVKTGSPLRVASSTGLSTAA